MRILGVDPGTARLGYGIVQSPTVNSRWQIVEYGCLTTKPNLSPGDRLLQLYQGLCDIIKRIKPDIMAVEELFFFKNLKTAIKVAEARGIILLAAKTNKISVSEHTPLEVKQAVAGYGRADKQQIQKMVKMLLGLEKIPKPDDAADALAVALTSAHSSRINQSLIISKQSRISFDHKKLIYPEISYKINGVLFKIYNELGAGYQEKYYYKLIELELEKAKIPFRKQVLVDLRYKNTDLGRYFIDYVIDNKIVLEIKAKPYFSQRDVKQVLAYLERSKIELGILASFAKQGVKTKRILRGFNN